MKLNQKLIQQLRNGEIAVENNGTKEQLKEVLKEAFPYDAHPEGSYKYYYMDKNHPDEWDCYGYTNLTIVSISDFYEPMPKTESNPIHYNVEGAVYSLDYQGLKRQYKLVVEMSDEKFMAELPKIAHLACIIATLKGLGNNATIGDKGIVHELIHLMTEPNEPTNNLQDIRDKFNSLIKLV